MKAYMAALGHEVWMYGRPDKEHLVLIDTLDDARENRSGMTSTVSSSSVIGIPRRVEPLGSGNKMPTFKRRATP